MVKQDATIQPPTRPRKPITFNDIMLMVLGVPLILSWLFFACFVIYSGINDETGLVQSNLDFYVALIAIVGSPALLFMNSVLESWKSEQQAELSALPTRIDSEMKSAEAFLAHVKEMENSHIQHEIQQAALRQKHELDMDDFNTKKK
tara:strand:+ start:12959 stop:13399 length:441 start_codon:yes stop_codon:yes gene_type:complete